MRHKEVVMNLCLFAFGATFIFMGMGWLGEC